MSGFEVAGIMLGVLPLIISAAEHYDDVFKPFKRYKRYAPEIEQYQQQLKTQKTIFLNQCQLLLASLIGRDVAKAMLKEKTHPSWHDSMFKERFARQLGCSQDACESTVRLIAEKLTTIEEEAEGFGSLIQSGTPLSSIGDKAWRSRVQKKLRFSFSESRLNEYLDDLRKLNHDFRTLAKQTTKLDIQQQSTTSSQIKAVYPTTKVEECNLVQRASTLLYEAFGRACQLHSEHSAHLQLQPQNVGTSSAKNPLVHFNMAFTHGTIGSLAASEPVWIAVDSTFVESTPPERTETITQKADESFSLTRTLSHNLLSEYSQPQKRQKTQKTQKCVRFATPSPACSKSGAPPLVVGSSNTIITTTHLHSTLPDFCVQHDFCLQLRKSCGSRTPQNKYLGYFEKTSPCKHLVSFAAPVTVCNYTELQSLAQIIAAMSMRAEIDQLLEYERLRLAVRLASAVLQFHATPLLRDFWQSEDVIFFGNGDQADSLSITSPHLNVQVGGTTQKIKPQTLETNTTRHLIRNPYLFSLGVTLIELAYQAPLRSLYRSEDLVDGEPNKLSDFFVATRLSKTIGSSLGSTYGTVVRKCLVCDFGQGTSDLNDSKLQATFYQDVVCELERLERGFAMLQLGC